MLSALAAYARTHDLPPDVAEDVARALALAAAAQTTAPTELDPHDVAATVELADEQVLDPYTLSPDPADRIAGRYDDLGELGTGGMGEVRRVRDEVLNRTLAMKLVHPRMVSRPRSLRRFVDEAQATAQLQHPNILPVHDVGRLPDGRLWYTMREVRGRSLAEVLDLVHDAGRRGLEAPEGWTLRRLMAAYLAVCHAVAYAHERGVVHRDLKPANVMLGAPGEVYVVDWGLARFVGRPDHAAEDGALEVSRTRRGDGLETRAGQVTGTPSYMPPEQARGEIDRIDARSDVYALGAILYEILSGRPPFEGSGRDVLRQVLSGPPPPVGRPAPTFGLDDVALEETSGATLPAELIAACDRAMAREPDDRFQTATDLAESVQQWLDGSRQRALALEVVEAALERAGAAEEMEARARDLAAEGAERLEDIEPWQPEEDKAAGWAALDEAASLEIRARVEHLRVEQALHGALQLSPSLPEAHAALAERHLAAHRVAAGARDRHGTAQAELLAVHHTSALPDHHPTRRRALGYWAGRGTLSLVTDPPGARVRLFRTRRHNRRLIEEFDRELGRTPLDRIPLPIGTWICELSHPDHETVRYPIEIEREAHWHGVAPGARAPTPVWLPPRGSLGPDDVYVPAGWFRAGGGPQQVGYGAPPLRLWCDAMVLQRFPVTNARYITFLDDLVAQGHVDAALRHAPRERSGVPGGQGALIYGFDGERFSLQPDADGDAWLPEYPVLMVDWYGACAYLEWLAARTGHPWRLPLGLEWEKAARGVDGRLFPWGDVLDPSWCCMTQSHRERAVPAVVDSYPVDVSVYGARGMGGNARDWCLEPATAPRPLDGTAVRPPSPVAVDPTRRADRASRGGNWDGSSGSSMVTSSFGFEPDNRVAFLSFRGFYRPEP